MGGYMHETGLKRLTKVEFGCFFLCQDSNFPIIILKYIGKIVYFIRSAW